MKTLWERRPARGECGKSAVRGMVIGLLLALTAIAIGWLGLG